MLWNSPISEARFEAMARQLGLEPGNRVLDVGCGTGEMLVRLAEQFGVQGVGIDLSGDSIDAARARATKRRVDEALEWIAGEASSYRQTGFDLAMCIGSTHAYSGGERAFEKALEALATAVKPGGLLLVGEAVMNREATPEYRELIEDFPPDHMTDAYNLERAAAKGLRLMASWASTEEEWDAFEYAHQELAETAARERPDDEQARAKLQFRRRWIAGYEAWGKETLGFVVYLFQVP